MFDMYAEYFGTAAFLDQPVSFALAGECHHCRSSVQRVVPYQQGSLTEPGMHDKHAGMQGACRANMVGTISEVFVTQIICAAPGAMINGCCHNIWHSQCRLANSVLH